MTIRKPPAKLAEPNLVTLEAGAIVHRVHGRNYGGNVFNPCKGSPTRFAPLYDAAGECVPSLYAAETLEAAIHETIFHDVPAAAKRKTVPRTLVQSRAHARLEVLRDLRTITHPCAPPDLRRWRIGRNSLIAASPKLYPETVSGGRAPFTAGSPMFRACCGPRTSATRTPRTSSSETGVKPEDFSITDARDGLFDTTFLSDVRLAGLRCGVTITTCRPAFSFIVVRSAGEGGFAVCCRDRSRPVPPAASLDTALAGLLGMRSLFALLTLSSRRR